MTPDEIDAEIKEATGIHAYKPEGGLAQDLRAIYRAGFAAGQAERDALRALLRDCATKLHDAPGLPLEIASPGELERWTDAITSLCILLNEYFPSIDAALKEGG